VCRDNRRLRKHDESLWPLAMSAIGLDTVRVGLPVLSPVGGGAGSDRGSQHHGALSSRSLSQPVSRGTAPPFFAPCRRRGWSWWTTRQRRRGATLRRSPRKVTLRAAPSFGSGRSPAALVEKRRDLLLLRAARIRPDCRQRTLAFGSARLPGPGPRARSRRQLCGDDRGSSVRSPRSASRARDAPVWGLSLCTSRCLQARDGASCSLKAR
jgi:hypothetical protein